MNNLVINEKNEAITAIKTWEEINGDIVQGTEECQISYLPLKILQHQNHNDHDSRYHIE